MKQWKEVGYWRAEMVKGSNCVETQVRRRNRGRCQDTNMIYIFWITREQPEYLQ